MRNQISKEKKIQELLRARERVRKKLEKVEAIFREEKENEEFWPGHSSTRYQTADNERHVFLEHLSLIEGDLKRLGYKEHKK